MVASPTNDPKEESEFFFKVQPLSTQPVVLANRRDIENHPLHRGPVLSGH